MCKLSPCGLHRWRVYKSCRAGCARAGASSFLALILMIPQSSTIVPTVFGINKCMRQMPQLALYSLHFTSIPSKRILHPNQRRFVRRCHHVSRFPAVSGNAVRACASRDARAPSNVAYAPLNRFTGCPFTLTQASTIQMGLASMSTSVFIRFPLINGPPGPPWAGVLPLPHRANTPL